MMYYEIEYNTPANPNTNTVFICQKEAYSHHSVEHVLFGMGELTKCVVGTPTSIYCILMRVDWEICIGVYRQCDCDINSKKLISYQANADAIRKTIYFSEEITHSSPIPINNYRMLMGARVDVGNIA